MWKLLSILAILANFILIVRSESTTADYETEIETEMETTHDDCGINMKTEDSNMDTTSSDCEMVMTKEDSIEKEPATTKNTKKLKTTTKSSKREKTTPRPKPTKHPKMTKHPKTTTTPKISKKPRTTKESGEETAINTDGSDDITSTTTKESTTADYETKTETEMETTRDDCGINMKTEDSNMDTTSSDCEMVMTTEDSIEKEPATTKKTKKLKTTTESSKGEKTTPRPKPTKHPKTTTTPKKSKKLRTTTESGEKTTINTDGSDDITTTTTKGPKDCKGKHEQYVHCAPACPQQTCDDYLNGVKCPKKTKLQHCKPECRCQDKYYIDEEANCVTPRECRKRARSTTVKPAHKDKTTKSSTTMMSTTREPECVDYLMEPFIIGNLGYTTKLLTALSQRDPGNNVIVGGASILYLFAQLVVEAKGKVLTLETFSEILETFNFNDTEQVTCFFPKVSAEINAEYFDIQYDLFCKIYADTNNALTTEFIESATEIFGMGPENLDFSSREAAQEINSEVANYTNNSFLNFVKPNILSPLDGLVFVDAEHFQGKWEKPFKTTDTLVKDFYTKGRIDKLPTMYLKGQFLYADSSRLSAKILILKYSGDRYSLAIILPYSLDGTRDLLRKMENPKTAQSALDSVKYENMEVYLPKFNISVATRLRKPALTASIKKAFNNATTDLEEIGSAEPPYVREILQKITFQVNEYGMGDATEPDFEEDIYSESKMVTKYQFKADHPFYFALMFDKIVLQAGLFIR